MREKNGEQTVIQKPMSPLRFANNGNYSLPTQGIDSIIAPTFDLSNLVDV